MPHVNLGVLAHVDAGKTTLTERLLFEAGVIDRVGSVDAGDTQTDTLALERRRGITIRSAVVSFAIDDTIVNLVDTPGHPDFIAEVERVLDILDGVVLVVSAVEGVQAQTRVLARVLDRLRIPTVVFVNKIDRPGARAGSLLDELRHRLTRTVVPMGAVTGIGTVAAAVTSAGVGVPLLPDATEALAEHDDGLLAAYVEGTPVPSRRLRQVLADLTSRCLVHPVFFGSARTGAGIDGLVVGIRRLLPTAPADGEAPPSAAVFAVERGAAGDKRVYVRVHRGTLRVRDRVPWSSGRTDRVTTLAVSAPGGLAPRALVTAGEIARVEGLAGARVGDSIGEPTRPRSGSTRFPPPLLETVVVPDDPAEAPAVHHALERLAEADPLIGLRRDDIRQETRLSLYGEVQKEVLQATLAEEHRLRVTFRGSRTLCVERPLGAGEAHERMGAEGNPFLATVGLRISPVPAGSGVRFELGVELGSMPAAFFAAVEATVRATLTQGLLGWDVPDCLVRMTHAGYAPRQSAMHAPFDKSMSSTGADFRGLTPLVVVEALRRAGTAVLEPHHRVTVDVPPDTVGAVWSLVSRLGGLPQGPLRRAGSAAVEGVIPAARLDRLRRGLPGITRGEAVLDSAFDSYRPVTGEPPTRPWIGPDPRHRESYLLAFRQGRRA